MSEPTDADAVVRGHRALGRYVLGSERVVLATRHHWARLLEPVMTAVVAFLVIALVVTVTSRALGGRVDVLWWLWLVALGRVGWRVLAWRIEWFVATDKRMLLLTGLVTHKVAMMPLHKVTDMSYSRSVLGRLLGYGEFVLESAGQDQAMRRIGWVPRPDATYRSLCATIFGPGGVPLPAHLRPAAVASAESPSASDALPPFFPPTGATVRRGDAPVTAVQYAAVQYATGPEVVLPYRSGRAGRGRKPEDPPPAPGPGDDRPAVWTAREKRPPRPH
jgi:hypothetical protein